jgi:chemotaxis family two-component system response regulator Rcp1
MSVCGGDGRPKQALLIEDRPGNVRRIQALHMHGASPGVEAMALLRQEGIPAHSARPGLILPDLYLPRMDGWEVLRLSKEYQSFETIPPAIPSAAEAEVDLTTDYPLHAHCAVVKPGSREACKSLRKGIHDFWLTAVRLPQQRQSG